MSQQAHVFETRMTHTTQLNYLLHLPADYRPDGAQQWPLILFLHGAGERGSDLEQIKIHGIPKIVAQQPDFPFITISPQCAENEWWLDKIEALSRLIDEVAANYAVDTRRIYLTGLSMGGHGCWHLATTYPQRFAAIAPICGWATRLLGFPERVYVLNDVPVWAFHGAKDDIVPVGESEKLVDALNACGGNARFTIYPHAEHDSWTQTYDNPELYEWFLRHKLSSQ